MLGSPHRYSTGLAPIDAQADFRRARRAYAVARVGRWVRRCRCQDRPRALAPTATLGAGPSRLEVVQLGEIVGTVEQTERFDSAFRPASEALRRRWEGIALAHRKGLALPPVVLRRQPDGYYVVDGRHRVSVARALRLGDIDAWVTGYVRK
jgi:ParB-like nuclease family protein